MTTKGMLRGKPAAGFFEKQGYRYITGQQAHPLANRGGSVAEHRKVLYDAIGPGPHDCHWGCGRTSLVWGGAAGIIADHVNGDRLDNRRVNLVPSCAPCNNSRGSAGNPPDWKPGQMAERCSRGHLFSEENTKWKGPRRRHCRICARDQDVKRQREKRRADREQGIQRHLPKPGHVGSHPNYSRGCRCADCTAAHAAYNRQHKAAQS